MRGRRRSITSAHILTGKDEKTISGIYQRLDQCRKIVVERDQEKIKYGQLMEWNDVEADEVDLGKDDDEARRRARIARQKLGSLHKP